VTDPAETDGYKTSDFVQKITEYLADGDKLDYVLVNNGPVSDLALRMYETEGKFPVQIDLEEKSEMVRNRVILGALCRGKEVLRHDSEILAHTILNLE